MRDMLRDGLRRPVCTSPASRKASASARHATSITAIRVPHMVVAIPLRPTPAAGLGLAPKKKLDPRTA